MKQLFILFFLLTVSFAHASDRHAKIIKSAIDSKCGSMARLTLVSVTEEVIHVDNGIRDVNYTSVYKGVLKIDQGVFDDYRITVKSHYGDSYDHTAQDWGHYSVSEVVCELE